MSHPTFRRGVAPACAALLAIAAAAPAAAQSLKPLVDEARRFDPLVQAARAVAESGGWRIRQAEAADGPSASTDALLGATSVLSPNGANRWQVGPTVGIGARLPLVNRANAVTIAQARRGADISREELRAAEQDLIVRVAQAYFDVLAAEETLAAAQTAKTAIAEQLAAARRAFEVGTATITDTREAQARSDLADARLIQADNDLATKRMVLEQLVGRPGVRPNPLADPAALPQLLPAPDAPGLLGQIDAVNPQIRRAELARDLARLDTERAKADAAPTLDLVGRLETAQRNGTLPTISGVSGQTSTATLGVQLNWPFFTNGRTEARQRETLLLEERAQQDLANARRSVEIATRTAALGVDSLRGQVRALEAAESSTKLALDATKLGYQVGVRVNVDVLNAQTQLFETRRDLAKARYDTIVNSLKLKQAAGTLDDSDVERIDRMLVK